MIKIDLRADKCIACKGCVQSCPVHIFGMKDSRAYVKRTSGCISCGHCVAICPTDAVVHSHFDEAKVHHSAANVEPLELLNLIRLRRSNRTFSEKPIPQESLDMIIEAAYRAPTASNGQEVKFLLIKDRTALDGVIDTTLEYFGGLVRKLGNPIVLPLVRAFNPSLGKFLNSFKLMIAQRAKGEDPILRGASAMLVIYADRSARFGVEDCNLAYQNASLMAEALGVAQAYTGFVCIAAKSSDSLCKLLGIEGRIYAGMMLGMPSKRFKKYIDRRDIDLKVI